MTYFLNLCCKVTITITINCCFVIILSVLRRHWRERFCAGKFINDMPQFIFYIMKKFFSTVLSSIYNWVRSSIITLTNQISKLTWFMALNLFSMWSSGTRDRSANTISAYNIPHTAILTWLKSTLHLLWEMISGTT